MKLRIHLEQVIKHQQWFLKRSYKSNDWFGLVPSKDSDQPAYLPTLTSLSRVIKAPAFFRLIIPGPRPRIIAIGVFIGCKAPFLGLAIQEIIWLENF